MVNQVDRIVEAAVAAIVTAASDPEILVLKRKLHPQDPWSGHYAFPGGRKDPEDGNLFVTCLRETREECGISLSSECLVKKYPVQYAGNHLNRPVPVTTYLFEIPRKPVIVLERSEITCYEWMPLSFIADQASRVHLPMSRTEPQRLFPAIPATDGLIWGFTYGVLMVLLADRYDGMIDIGQELGPVTKQELAGAKSA
ncbi:MAG: CoA pyrophosphatase [Desulfobulbaceae bacterium]|nr:CoA pyrophosphatase [Desulfobulbaceae bacterium]